MLLDLLYCSCPLSLQTFFFFFFTAVLFCCLKSHLMCVTGRKAPTEPNSLTVSILIASWMLTLLWKGRLFSGSDMMINGGGAITEHTFLKKSLFPMVLMDIMEVGGTASVCINHWREVAPTGGRSSPSRSRRWVHIFLFFFTPLCLTHTHTSFTQKNLSLP